MAAPTEDHFVECSEMQLRQYIDSRTAFLHALQAKRESREVRGSMLWREINGTEYLIRNNAGGGQHSLGKRSTETERIYERFTARKQSATDTLKARTLKLDEARKLNRVYGVGRTPNTVVSILQEMERAGIADQFITVGTHALYAYESFCGVRVQPGAMATQGIDPLFDTRKRVAFMSVMNRIDTSLVGVLQRADKSFRVLSDRKQTAVNNDGFEVDLIRRDAKDGDPHPLRMSDDEDDFWAAQVSSGERLMSGRVFEQVVVSASGQMAMMRTVHPLQFIAVKNALSESHSREPEKKPRDALQAKIVQRLWEEFMQSALLAAERAKQAQGPG